MPSPAASRLDPIVFPPVVTQASFGLFAARPALFAENLSHFTPSGAAQSNARYEANRRPDRFIEQQRYGVELVAAGLINDQPRWIDTGLRAYEYAAAQQTPAGDFRDGLHAVHSAALMVESAARAVLLLQSRGRAERYADRLAPITVMIEKAAHWLAHPARPDDLFNEGHELTHRFYIMSAMFLQAARVTGRDGLIAAARANLDAGLPRQDDAGVNAEHDGYDVNYQSAGVLFGLYTWAACDDPALRDALRAMIERGVGWLLPRVGEDGEVDVSGSTRVGSDRGRDGQIKNLNFKEFPRVLAGAAVVCDRPDFAVAAARVVAHPDWPRRFAPLFPTMGG